MRRPSAHLPLALFLFLLAVNFACHEFGTDRNHSRPRHHPTQEAFAQVSPQSPPTLVPGQLTRYGLPVAHRMVGPFHVLNNIGYISGYDAGLQDPLWVETRFFEVDAPVSEARPSQFSTDPRIEPQNQVDTHYWTNSGYDRGHMAPNWGVSTCYGRQAQIETFLLTNVTPQTPQLNRGLWETVEKIISNDYARRFHEVWVICGPVFGPDHNTLKNGKVAIPVSCYKIILRVDSNGTPHCLAMIMPEDLPMTHQQSQVLQYLTNVAEVEKATGITFFPDLPPQERSRLENENVTKLW